MRFFALQYRKTHFLGLYCLKNITFTQNIKKKSFTGYFAEKIPLRKIRCFEKRPWTNAFGNFFFWIILELQFYGRKSILFYPEYQKTNLSYLLCTKNTLEKVFEFLTKTVDKPIWKIMIFLICLKFHFSFL